MNRTGRPPILDTAASLRSDETSTGPSGIPKNTDVSVRIKSSSSSSDQSCRVEDAIAESRLPTWNDSTNEPTGVTRPKEKEKENQIRHEWKGNRYRQ
jgi:hypothetical protein